MRAARVATLFVLTAFSPVFTTAAELTLTLPDGVEVKSASAANAAKKLNATGAVDGRTIRFANLQPDTLYDVQLTLSDGKVLQGVDLAWYNEEPAKPDAGAMTDDDREGVRAIVQDVKDFYNKKDALLQRGDHARAVCVVQLVRDTDFYEGKGQVVWRTELWYFKNQFGGWEKVAQQNKVLRRERFKTAAEYKAAAEKVRYVAELGGVRVAKEKGSAAVTLSKEAIEGGNVRSDGRKQD
jgi:hypothetical protein